MQSSLALSVVAIAALVGSAFSETHIVHFDNRCGDGTPTLIQDGNVLSTGADYISNGPLVSAIAYLQTGSCGFNGENCTLIETTLMNPAVPGIASTADINLIPPHAFNVASGFYFDGGCSGVGEDCVDANCPTAFHTPDQIGIVTLCEASNVNFNIVFCG